MKLRYYSIPLLVVLACAAVALVVRLSYTSPDRSIYDYILNPENSFFWDKEPLVPPDANEIINQSDMIVKAKFDGQRDFNDNGFYTTVTVSEVYQGDQTWVGKQLCVIEELAIIDFTQYLNTGGRVYLPLQEGEEYILLLKWVDFLPQRELTPRQATECYPTTQSSLSTYRLTNTVQTELFEYREDHPVTLNSMKGLDLAVNRQADLDYYYKTKNEIFEQFGIVVS